MPLSDPELLSRYLDSHDETAFTALVARYLPLVRGVLYRATHGKPELVDELAMQTFATLAQRASRIRKRPSIGGWLVITARQKASTAMRNDTTRRKYMDRLAAQPASSTEPGDIEDIFPYLDAALTELPEVDRQAVILRFYEKLPYREVGKRLGRKEDATRKRVNRALEQMSTFLQRRGITLSAAMLAGGLTSQLTATTAHATSASAISNQSLAMAAKVTTSATAFSIKWLIPSATVVLIAGSTAYIAARLAGLPPVENTHPDSQKQLTTIQESRDPAPTLAEAVVAELTKPVAERVRRAANLWELSRRKQSPTAGLEHRAILESFTAEECKEAISILDRDYDYNYERHWRMVHDLILTMVRADARATALYALDRRRAGDPYWQSSDRFKHPVKGWAKLAPNEINAWLNSPDFPAELLSDLIEPLISGTSLIDPKAALEIALALPWQERREVISEFESMEDPILRETMIQHTSAIADEFERAEVFRTGVLGFLKNQNEIEDTFALMEFTRSDAVVPVVEHIIKIRLKEDDSDRAKIYDFAIKTLPEAGLPILLDGHIRKWLKVEPAKAEAWLLRHELNPEDVTAATRSFIHL